MVTETICLAVLKTIRGRSVTVTKSLLDNEPTKSTEADATTDAEIYRPLLARYELSEIEASIRWLEHGGYLGRGGATIHGPYWRSLTEKGRLAADQNQIPADEKKLLYQEVDPYAVFVAHQFNQDDSDLVEYLRSRVLGPMGFKMVDGRAEGLEEFRSAIVSKIRRSRFFLCLLTKRTPLASGSFASSVWLYQETGVAVAFGKKPLLLVEDGLDAEYIGELQRIYEHIPFSRSNHPDRFDAVGRRLLVDLDVSGVPSPQKVSK